jgi:hypothetical protein
MIFAGKNRELAGALSAKWQRQTLSAPVRGIGDVSGIQARRLAEGFCSI